MSDTLEEAEEYIKRQELETELELETNPKRKAILAKKLKKTEIPETSEELLKNPEILSIITKDIQKRVYGYDKEIKTILLFAIGGTVTLNCDPISQNLLVSGTTGVGKDYVVGNILKSLDPKLDNQDVEDSEKKVIKRERITPTTITYWHTEDKIRIKNPAYSEWKKRNRKDRNDEEEPDKTLALKNDWTWNNKILYLQDPDPDVINNAVFKVMASTKDGKATVTKDQKVVEKQIHGKPTIIITMAEPNFKNQLIRRFSILWIKSSEETNIGVIEKQLELAQAHGNLVDCSISDALKKLKNVNVIIPYTGLISKVLTKYAKNTIIRSQISRIIDIIKFSAAIHQYQREANTKDNYVIANGEDWDNMVFILTALINNSLLQPLTEDEQVFINTIARMEKDRVETSVKEIMDNFNLHGKDWVYNTLEKLKGQGFINSVTVKDSFKPYSVYVVQPLDQFVLPLFSDISISANSAILPERREAPKK